MCNLTMFQCDVNAQSAAIVNGFVLFNIQTMRALFDWKWGWNQKASDSRREKSFLCDTFKAFSLSLSMSFAIVWLNPFSLMSKAYSWLPLETLQMWPHFIFIACNSNLISFRMVAFWLRVNYKQYKWGHTQTDRQTQIQNDRVKEMQQCEMAFKWALNNIISETISHRTFIHLNEDIQQQNATISTYTAHSAHDVRSRSRTQNTH